MRLRLLIFTSLWTRRRRLVHFCNPTIIHVDRLHVTKRVHSTKMAKPKTAHGDALVINAVAPEATNYNVKLVEPNLKGDWMNIALLMLLYIMQSLPLGLSMAIPILLQSNKNVTYNDQVNYPYVILRS